MVIFKIYLFVILVIYFVLQDVLIVQLVIIVSEDLVIIVFG